MSKIVLDSEPNLSFDRCPLMYPDRNECILGKFHCPCIGGYYDSLSFDFDECPYCTTIDKVK